MRLSLWIIAACLACASYLLAAEPAPTSAPVSPSTSNREWPLWDGKETVAEYAQRVNLPPTKTLDLGNGVTLELVLIPAGTFIMGTPEPVPVDEDAFHKRIVIGQALVAASAATLLVLLAFVVARAIRRKSWPQVSLGRLLVLTAVAGVGLYGGMHWRQAAQELQQGLADFELAKVRFANSEQDEKPAHPVTLTKPFYMGKYEVTQAQYAQIQRANPSLFQGPNNPVEKVSWEDADVFCQKANAATGETFRLPTEAEWEYACRAGTQSVYSSGDQEADLGRVGWYDGNSQASTHPHPVGEKAPNFFGLFDMHGNVWEWCADWYAESYFATSPAVDPTGPASSEYRVLRGGSWIGDPQHCRVACRICNSPASRLSGIGFRVVVEVSSRTP